MVKITVGIDRFTDLRSKIRRAIEDDDDDARRDASDEFIAYMRDRWSRGTLSLAEKLWLDAHPKFEQMLELGDEAARLDGRWYDFPWEYYKD